MIQFANPVWLWGLLGLFIPVGIHLLSRKEGRVIAIGSLRHLRESDTAQFSSIRLNEILLLLLRCLLLVLIILFLAGAGISNTTFSGEKWLVLEKGIEKEVALQPIIDSLSAQGYELRSLVKDFPLLADSDYNNEASPDYWALAENLAARSGNDIVVLSYNEVNGFKGKRTAMPENIRWIAHEPAPSDYVIKAVSTGMDSVWMRTAQTSAEATVLKTRKARREAGQSYFKLNPSDSAVIENSDTINITVFYDAPFGYDLKILEASLGAVQTTIPYKIIVDKKPAAQYQATSGWTIWLSDKKMPATPPATIAYHACSGTLQPLIMRGAHAGLFCNAAITSDWVITHRLTEGAALHENMSVTLAFILLSGKTTVTPEKDKRSVPEAMMWSGAAEKEMHKATIAERSSLDTYLAMALFLSLITERWLAFNRNQ
jgi:hypothetical protein